MPVDANVSANDDDALRRNEKKHVFIEVFGNRHNTRINSSKSNYNSRWITRCSLRRIWNGAKTRCIEAFRTRRGNEEEVADWEKRALIENDGMRFAFDPLYVELSKILFATMRQTRAMSFAIKNFVENITKLFKNKGRKTNKDHQMS